MKRYNKKGISSARDLGARTAGEELWLARKRKGSSAAEAARRAGLGTNAYREAEADLRPAPEPRKAGLGALKPPSLPELLRLARRRSGRGLEALAKAIRTTRVTFLAKEGGGDPVLLAFWKAEYFRFPE